MTCLQKFGIKKLHHSSWLLWALAAFLSCWLTVHTPFSFVSELWCRYNLLAFTWDNTFIWCITWLPLLKWNCRLGKYVSRWYSKSVLQWSAFLYSCGGSHVLNWKTNLWIGTKGCVICCYQWMTTSTCSWDLHIFSWNCLRWSRMWLIPNYFAWSTKITYIIWRSRHSYSSF